MGLVSEIKRELRFLQGPSKANTLNKLDRFIITGLDSGRSAAGIEVTEEAAEKLTAFWRGVEIISQTIGMLPLKVYRMRPDGGKEEARDHFLWPLLHDAANEEHTAIEFREAMQGWLCVRNNALAVLDKTASGRTTRMVPINPDRVEAFRDKENELFYRIQFDQEQADFHRSRILHVRGRMKDGIWGRNRLLAGTDAIGRGLAVQEHTSKFFANSTILGGVLSSKKPLGDDGRKNLRKGFEEMHKGVGKAYKIGIFEDDITWQSISISPEQAQLIASAEFTIDDISRLLGVPIHMLAKEDAQAFKNVEVLSIEFVIYGLLPTAKKWEQAISRDLIPERERGKIFAEFNFNSLLRGDQKTRFDAYATARQWGWMTANDVKRFENENPVGPEGDILLVPLNMINAKSLINADNNADNSAAQDNLRILKERVRTNYENAYRGLFLDAFTRISKRELKEVERGLAKFFSKDVDDLYEFLNKFYKSFESVIEQILFPVYEAFLNSTKDFIQSHDARKLARDKAKEYVSFSRLSLSNGAVHLDDWKVDRAEKETEKCLEELFDDK